MADPLADRGVCLVPIAQSVDEAGVHGLLSAHRSGVDELADPLLRESSALGDRGHRVVEDRPDDLVDRLTVRVGVARARQHVGGVLVLVALPELGLDPEAVQRRADERRLHGHAERSDGPARLQPELVQSTGQGERGGAAGPRAEVLSPRQCGFATGGERSQPESQLGRGCPREAASDLHDQSRHVRVGSRLVQGSQDRRQLRSAARGQPSERIVRVHRDRCLGQVQLEQQRSAAVGEGGHGCQRRAHDGPGQTR